jgi:hypothetical protein
MYCEILVFQYRFSMAQSHLLREKERLTRRTVADAIDVLREFAGFGEHDHAEIRINVIPLPSKQTVGVILLRFDAPSDQEVFFVSLPTSGRFNGRREGSSRPATFEISQLDGALVDANATVRLRNGELLRAVEVVPASLPLEPSELDWKIVHHTISVVGAEKRCDRTWRTNGHRVIDCKRLPTLKPPPLKELAWRLAEQDPALRGVSPQKIADALRFRDPLS